MTYEEIYIAKLLMNDYEDINISPEKIENYFLRSALTLILKAIELQQKPSIIFLCGEGLKPVSDVAKLTDNNDPRVTIKKCEEEILKSWKLRSMAKVLHNSALSITDKKDPEEIYEYLDCKLNDILNENEEDIDNVIDLYKERLDVYENRYRNRYTESQILTGINELDDKIFNLQLGKYIVVGGRPSQGKTSLMLSIALNTSLKYKSAFVTIESSKKEILDRMVCNTGHINNQSLISGHLSKRDFDSFAIVHGELLKRELTVIQPKVNTATNIIILIKKLIRAGHKIIFLDYIQKIRPTGLSRREDIEMISGDLCELCKRYDILLFVGAQALRNAENKKPTKADLKESGRLEEDADIIIFPYLEYDETDIRQIKQARLIIAKHRDGIIGDIKVTFEPMYYKFY